ncbi:MAG: hypothetical protein PHQ86_06485 [Dehalococcoidales bacterium]|nr:hypothetical protein [Dehalococcoidales bacterium]
MLDGYQIDRMKIIPEVGEPVIKKVSVIDGRSLKLNDKGINYIDGMGCHRHPNCFDCPFTDCKFQNNSDIHDLLFLSNRGDGIKVW